MHHVEDFRCVWLIPLNTRGGGGAHGRESGFRCFRSKVSLDYCLSFLSYTGIRKRFLVVDSGGRTLCDVEATTTVDTHTCAYYDM